MTHTVSRPTLAQLQDRITAQLATLRDARARAEHCASAGNREVVELAEARLNGLIAQWGSEVIRQQAEQIADGRWKP